MTAKNRIKEFIADHKVETICVGVLATAAALTALVHKTSEFAADQAVKNFTQNGFVSVSNEEFFAQAKAEGLI